MDEVEWQSCLDPTPMLSFLFGKANERKLRLFACACCRYLWANLIEEPWRNGIGTIELLADGMAPEWDWQQIALNVNSPMFGTYYAHERPGAPRFVTVGSLVSPETVVSLI